MCGLLDGFSPGTRGVGSEGPRAGGGHRKDSGCDRQRGEKELQEVGTATDTARAVQVFGGQEEAGNFREKPKAGILLGKSR